MPTQSGLNVSQLVADEMMVQLLDSTPLPEFAGNIGEAEWGQKTYAINRTIEIPKVNFFIANQGMTASDSTLEEDLVPVTVQEPINVMLPYDSYDQMLTIGGPNKDPEISIGWKKRIMNPQIAAIRAKLETLLMYELERTYYMTAGTAGTPLSSAPNLGPLNALFTRMEIPDEDKALIVSPENYSTLGGGLTTLFNPGYTNGILRDLNLPMVFDFGLMKSNYVSRHAYGTAAMQALTVLTTMTPGATTIILTGATAGFTLKAGDKFTIANVNHVTPTGKVDYGQLMGFTVYSDTVADGSGHIPVTLSVPYWDGTSTRQNVTAMPQAAAAITFKGQTISGAKYHTSNFAIVPNSLTLSSLKMSPIKGAETGYSTDATSQMIIRVCDQGVVQTSVNRLRVDIAPVFKAFADYGVDYLT